MTAGLPWFLVTSRLAKSSNWHNGECESAVLVCYEIRIVGAMCSQPSNWLAFLFWFVIVMRLKKSKEPETKKSQQIDNISRLICTSKSQNHPLSGRGKFLFRLLGPPMLLLGWPIEITTSLCLPCCVVWLNGADNPSVCIEEVEYWRRVVHVFYQLNNQRVWHAFNG